MEPVRRLPPTQTLLAFDVVARLGGVTRAAEALGTSQAAISRHIKRLERELGIALLVRDGRGVALSPEGLAYWKDIGPALAFLQQAGARARVSANELTIACTHEVSHLLIMPRFAALRRALGRKARVRMLTCEYQAVPAMVDAGADIVFEYRAHPPRRTAAAVVREAIRPVATAGFAERHARLLGRAPAEWVGIPRLALTKQNTGWASWEDWFAAQGAEPPTARVETFDNYVYALEAATAGEGMVLAWQGFAERYLESGALVPLTADWHVCGATLYACLTEAGAANPLARTGLRFLSGLLARGALRDGRPV